MTRKQAEDIRWVAAEWPTLLSFYNRMAWAISLTGSNRCSRCSNTLIKTSRGCPIWNVRLAKSFSWKVIEGAR